MIEEQTQRAAEAVSQAEIELRLKDLLEDTDLDFLNDLVHNFLTVAPGMVEEIRSAMERRDPVKAARVAHSLLGNCATFGLVRLAEALRQFEQNCKKNELAAAGEQWFWIQTNYPVAQDELEVVSSRILES